MPKITLSNGQEVEVSKDVYERILAEADETKYYNSNTKGKILIKEMNSQHLKNAITKKAKEEAAELLEGLRQTTDWNFVRNLENGILFVKDKNTLAMFNELKDRALSW